ncbi:glucosamine-6-phosphate deaminase [Ornithinibacillus halophilus]|uniref:Glucosamine-6-phosphate deaminase n=1 Tax=Ornithinibacillus halophilus TaxID=930117 RepID=A0A1M5FD52_9BACI|nr:glucosamine-6-phosphate deaminase [Ornithinibacillus halophilus]SHF89465.1 glucosamine-6-phosphate deaminase [Ornithinibacillus halophilus]
MNIVKVANYESMSLKACEKLTSFLKTTDNPVLGLATGSTPEGLYRCLIEKQQQGEISFNNTTTFNLDEYVGLKGNDPNSYRYFMNDKLFDHIDIQLENTHIPNGETSDMNAECETFEKELKEKGPVDIQILGLGLNGHIGFNEPGTPFNSRTHVVELDESTRQANSRFFSSIDEVPKHAITMGIDTIMESKEIILLVSGENKAEAVKKLVQGEVTEEFPASILQKHSNVTIIADEAALSQIKEV